MVLIKDACLSQGLRGSRLQRLQKCQYSLLIRRFQLHKPLSYLLGFTLVAAYRVIELD